MDVRTWEAMGERLIEDMSVSRRHIWKRVQKVETYNNITPNAILFPCNTWIEAFDNKISSFMSLSSGLVDIAIQVIWFCFTSIIIMSMRFRTRKKCVLGTPALNNSCEPHLFRIIGNIWAKAIDCLPIMPIGTPNNLWLSHSGAERGKNSCKTHMIHLAYKALEFRTLSLPFICCIERILRWAQCLCVEKRGKQNWLLGIGRNATGRTEFPWARRAVLVRFPGDW